MYFPLWLLAFFQATCAEENLVCGVFVLYLFRTSYFQSCFTVRTGILDDIMIMKIKNFVQELHMLNFSRHAICLFLSKIFNIDLFTCGFHMFHLYMYSIKYSEVVIVYSDLINQSCVLKLSYLPLVQRMSCK